jgi:hypothetical protein
MSRLKTFMNEEFDDTEIKAKEKKNKASRKKSKDVLKKEMRKLDDHIDVFATKVEDEIEKIEDNPVFKYKLQLMLTNMEKEQGEFLIALRQVVHTIGTGIVPQARGHAKGIVPEKKPEEDGQPQPDDNEEDVRDVDTKEEEE